MNSWLAQQQVQAEYDAQPLWQTETAQQRQGQRYVSRLAEWPIPVHPVAQLQELQSEQYASASARHLITNKLYARGHI